MAKKPATAAAATAEQSVTETATTSTGETANDSAATGAKGAAGAGDLSGSETSAQEAAGNDLSADGATSAGGLVIATDADLAKAVSLIDPNAPGPHFPTGMDVNFLPDRRFATVASAIEHDGEVAAQDDLILLTEKEFEKLRPTGALQERSWDECEPL